MPTFDPSQPYEVISEPRVTRGSTFGDQNGLGSDSGDNGQFAYGGSSVNDQEDYAALPAGSNVPPGYQFPVLNPATGDVTWVTHRDKGPAKWTGRGVDLAPSAMEKLHAQTDDPLVVDTAKAVPPFDPSKPYQVVGATKPPQSPAIPSPTLSQEVGPPQPIGTATGARTQHLIDSSHVVSQRDLEDIAASLPGYQQSQEAASRNDTRDKLTKALGNNVAPFVEHPLQAAYNTIVPNKQDLDAIAKLVTNPKEAFARDTPVGSQEYYNQLVGYALPLLMAGAGKAFKGEAAPEAAAKQEAAAPPPEPPPPRFDKPVEGTEGFARVNTEPLPTHELIRRAIDWQNKLQDERVALDKQGQIAQAVSGRVPRDITDRIGEIDAEIKAGYQPEGLTNPLNAAMLKESDFRPNEDAAAGQPDTATEQPASVASAETSGDVETGGQGATEGDAGTSNRVFAEAHGEEAVPGGKGVDTSELLDNARANLRAGSVDPYSILSKTRYRGIANPEEYAALAAEHERLVNDAVAKEKASDPSAPEAAKAAEDFANAIQPHKTAASDLMRLFQGDLNYDLGTPFGIDQYMKAEIGRGMKPSEAPGFQKMAQGIRQAEGGVAEAVGRSDVRVRSRYAKVADIPMEDAAARVRQQLSDCLV